MRQLCSIVALVATLALAAMAARVAADDITVTDAGFEVPQIGLAYTSPDTTRWTLGSTEGGTNDYGQWVQAWYADDEKFANLYFLVQQVPADLDKAAWHDGWVEDFHEWYGGDYDVDVQREDPLAFALKSGEVAAGEAYSLRINRRNRNSSFVTVEFTPSSERWFVLVWGRTEGVEASGKLQLAMEAVVGNMTVSAASQ